jgi:hypothetical protein
MASAWPLAYPQAVAPIGRAAMKRFVAAASLLLCAALITGCGQSEAEAGAQQHAAADAAANAVASDVDAADVTEDGYSGCTDDCSGHEAVYEWARDSDASDESDCGGNSDSFIEGCEQFVQARREEAERQAAEKAQGAENGSTSVEN